MPDPAPEPWLLRDERPTLGTEPGLHALLIGVSEYAYLPDADEPPGEGFRELQRLRFAARSAFKLWRKLEELDAGGRLHRPLKTVRLLTVPSALELRNEPGIPDIPPTFGAIEQAVRRWRDDLACGTEEVGVFYFAGHGIRRYPGESILLASDFLEDEENVPLRNTFLLSNVKDGMAPSRERPNMSLHQYYFVDACRETSKPLAALISRDTSNILAPVINKTDLRSTPTYLATPPGGVAEGTEGQQTAFLDALLWALDHGSSRKEYRESTRQKEWPVKPTSLKNALRCFHPKFGGLVVVDGIVGESTLCYAQDPPIVKVRIDFKPAEMMAAVQGGQLLSLRNHQTVQFGRPEASPCEIKDVSAGLYSLKLVLEPDDPDNEAQEPEMISVDLPVPWAVKVGR